MSEETTLAAASQETPTEAGEGKNLPAIEPSIAEIAERVRTKIEADQITLAMQQKAHAVRAKVANEPQQLWFPLAPMPTDMCRCSPFFPLRQKDLADREWIQDMIISSGAWGTIKYSGPQLSTYDEDILLALLALLDQGANRETIERDQKKTYRYRGKLSRILSIAGMSDSQANYNRAVQALLMMKQGVLKLDMFRRDPATKKRYMETFAPGFFYFFSYSERTKEVEIIIDVFFYECYVLKGSVTMLDVRRRAQIKSPISKALYRFIISHDSDTWRGHITTLATALNLKGDLAVRKKKERIKNAIGDLVTHKILVGGKDGSCFLSEETVRLVRHPKVMKRRKEIG